MIALQITSIVAQIRHFEVACRIPEPHIFFVADQLCR